MLAYCTRLGIPRGWLVYADLSGEPSQTTRVRGSGTEIVVSSLDITGSVGALKTAAAQLATSVVAAQAPA